jgi:6,7-dimethyl-8-ribityllumazine synthase
VKVYEGRLDAQGMRVGIVASRFNETVVRPLVDGAVGFVRRHGGDDQAIELAWVPGAWELPLVARRMAETGRFDAIVAVGAVIRGETAHFDYVANQAAEIGKVALETGVPVGNAVLTTESFDQAVDRAGGKLGNKGWEAAQAAVETARLLAELK